MADDDDDEGGFEGLYEDGHWAWDDSGGSLVFVSDLLPQTDEVIQMPIKAPTGTIEFRDDIDLIEQIRFRRRYQRKLKPGQADIINLQDIKDLALFTAPLCILSPSLINLLHSATTERFLRALTLYCGYYLQISEEVSLRILDLEKKIRTPESDAIESEYRDNLGDLRLLVAKEYATMILGGADTRKLHHMGPDKKSRSLSDKDARLYETLLRMAAQIVWLALGRKSFNQIELEICRIFKSEIYNSVEHLLKTGCVAKMTTEERGVLLGNCARRAGKLSTRSPLLGEVFCRRDVDHRLMGLGVIRCPRLSPRLRYLSLILFGAEEVLQDSNVSLGIIGLPRSSFDTMLRPLPEVKTKESASSMSMKFSPSRGTSSTASKASAGSIKRSQMVVKKLYPDIVLPPKEPVQSTLPKTFPEKIETVQKVNETQRRRWLTRLMKLTHSNR